MIFVAAGPLWLRVLITIAAAVLFVILARRYYLHYRKRK